MKSDLDIAQACTLKPIRDIAASIGIDDDLIEPYGDYKAKVRLEFLDRYRAKPDGRYIVVTGITPTPLGEGKTVTTVGLAQGLAKLGKKAACCIRQPSMGPVFGIKGGAAGGGLSQVVPMEDFNLHLTGDMHAVSSAHALLSALIDTLMLKGNPGRLDPTKVTWRRCVDMNDVALRSVVIGLGGNAIPRETGFDLTSASEIMAVLALARSLSDLRQRLGKIVIGYTHQDLPAFADDIKAAGAMAVLLKDAIKPNLLQTLEHVPAFVHAGPFANIAHGNSSILADQIALKACDVVLTEAGFGADMGFEKFCHIKCRASELTPDAAVLVATIRAVKAHSDRFRVIPGRPIDPRINEPNVNAVREGLGNLQHHLATIAKFGLPCVVAVNRFPTDSDEELDTLVREAKAAGAFDAVISEVHTQGGDGGRTLAEAVLRAAESSESSFRFLYELDDPIADKIRTVATQVYGAADVEFAKPALAQIENFTQLGYTHLPVCMAKTQYSISHDPSLKGRPSGYVLPVREVRLAGGAGFLTPLCGAIQTMPAFGRHPAAVDMDIDPDGRIHGLF